MSNKTLRMFILIMMFIGMMTMSYGYAALNEELSISGEAMVRVDADVRIIDYKMVDAANGAYENYASNYSINTINNSITLPNLDSSMTYEITVRNQSSAKVKIDKILSLIHSNTDIQYEIIGYSADTFIEPTSIKQFKIKYAYNDGVTKPLDKEITSMIEFQYKSINYFQILYENIDTTTLPSSILENSDFKGYIGINEGNLKIYMDGKQLDKSSYTYENGTLIIPNVTGDLKIVNSGNLKVTYTENSWNDGTYYYHQYDFKLENIGTTDIDGWKIAFKVPNDTEIIGAWNVNTELNSGVLAISNSNTNSIIKSGESLIFVIQIKTKDKEYKIGDIGINGEDLPTNPDDEDNNEDNDDTPTYDGEKTEGLDVKFKLVAYWGNEGDYYLQYDVNLYNNTSNNMKDWYLKFSVPKGTTMEHYWNCNYVLENNTIILTSAGFNNELQPQSSTTLGIIINTPDSTFVPEC